ncbi:hypothetical protein WN51_13979 [Melipona quadrifasciata]|uniref:Uncharacterized protein n=1 Tax=Melipona quadrifasciata TaxID=166423 RepID=A0A0N0U501_9HYME|nr:hypothetical protein WN51_13979 [Melipona quadrifasciata]
MRQNRGMGGGGGRVRAKEERQNVKRWWTWKETENSAKAQETGFIRVGLYAKKICS